MTVLGLLVRHRQALHLDRVYLGQWSQPFSHHAGPSVRADLFVSRLFSALLTSHAGGLVLDALAVFWGIAALTGLLYFFAARRRRGLKRSPSKAPVERVMAMGVAASSGGSRRGNSRKVLEFRRR